MSKVVRLTQDGHKKGSAVSVFKTTKHSLLAVHNRSSFSFSPKRLKVWDIPFQRYVYLSL